MNKVYDESLQGKARSKKILKDVDDFTIQKIRVLPEQKASKEESRKETPAEKRNESADKKR